MISVTDISVHMYRLFKAISMAISQALGKTFVLSRESSTRPIESASFPLMLCEESIISIAFFTPIRRGSRCVPP